MSRHTLTAQTLTARTLPIRAQRGHALPGHAVSRLAGDPAKAPVLSLDGVSALVFTLLGSIIMAVVGVRMFTAYTKKAWGELITELVAVVFIGWFVWFPGSAQTTIQGIIHGVFG